MMGDTEENVQIDYNTLVLRHLDRLSLLTTRVVGDIKELEGRFVNIDESRKTAMQWATFFLDALVPVDLQDKKYVEVRKRIDTNLKAREGKEKGFPLWYYLERINNAVDLFARKGRLFETRAILKVTRDGESSEVYEE